MNGAYEKLKGGVGEEQIPKNLNNCDTYESVVGGRSFATRVT